MTRLRLAAAPLNQTPLDWHGNRDRISAALTAARDAGAAIVCLPELTISGYGCEDSFFSAGVQRTSLEMLAELLPATKGLAACLGLPLLVDGELYNACAMACDGSLLGIVCKQHLAGDGIHYEPRWFRRWPAGVVQQVDLSQSLGETGVSVPVGDLLFDLGGVRVGMEICRDAWVAERTGASLAARGADVLLNPSASHFAFGKQEVRRRIALEGSRIFSVSFVYCNLLGNESGRAIYDGGALIASAGQMLAEGPRLAFGDMHLTLADVDVNVTRRKRAAGGEPTGPATEHRGLTLPCDFNLPSAPEIAPITTLLPAGEKLAEGRMRGELKADLQSNPPSPQPSPASGRGSSMVESDASEWPESKEEEFARAVALGLFDYLRKSRAQGFVVSLSGGADSSAVATLVWLMVRLGVAELGRDGFVDRLRHVATLPDCADERAIVGALLSCVYQSTRNSGDVTRKAASGLAEAIGAQFHKWPIDAMVDGYVDTVSQALGRDLTWDADDVALQNIQARARGPAAWLLANLRGALLLTTSNRSEAAVGYATMDGDTCGGLAPIAGIDKAYLLHWLRWMESAGPSGLGPLPALSAVNAQTPTAELRPPGQSQTDEGDLMPYDVLDAIERHAVRDKLPPVEVLAAMQREFGEPISVAKPRRGSEPRSEVDSTSPSSPSGGEGRVRGAEDSKDDVERAYSAQQLGAWVERFFRLWCRNQWKRERYAPSFHLDDENLDPKTWCRFPILSGGYEKEIEELRAAIQYLQRDF